MTTGPLPATPGVELPVVSWQRQPKLPFAVRVERLAEDAALVILQGELDSCTAPRFRDAVDATIGEGTRAIVVDLSELAFIDAAGLGVVVMAARPLGPGAVALILPHAGLIRLFRICGLDRLLEIHETRDAAQRSLLRSA
jgi:anti-sigma B factor antagonist